METVLSFREELWGAGAGQPYDLGREPRPLWKGKRSRGRAKLNRPVEPLFPRVPYLREDPENIDGHMEPAAKIVPAYAIYDACKFKERHLALLPRQPIRAGKPVDRTAEDIESTARST